MFPHFTTHLILDDAIICIFIYHVLKAKVSLCLELINNYLQMQTQNFVIPRRGNHFGHASRGQPGSEALSSKLYQSRVTSITFCYWRLLFESLFDIFAIERFYRGSRNIVANLNIFSLPCEIIYSCAINFPLDVSNTLKIH